MEKIILKHILKNHAVRVWTEVIGLMINYVLNEMLGHISLRHFVSRWIPCTPCVWYCRTL